MNASALRSSWWGALGMFVAWLGNAEVHSADYGDWVLRNPLPTADHLRTVAYGNDRFIAAGDRTTILTSSDGLAWIEYVLRTNLFRSIAFGNGLFVGAGYNGMSHSTDGLSWTLDAAVQFEEVKWVNQSFVAVGGSRVGFSGDGIHWDIAYLENYFFQLGGVAYGNGKYVAVGYYVFDPEESAYGVMATSPDGTNWVSAVNSNLPPMRAVAFGNGVFVGLSGSRFLYSDDAVNWTPVESGYDAAFWDLVFADGIFVAVGDRTALFTSANGRDWTRRNVDQSMALQAITHGGGKFVAVGGFGGILVSRDGLKWQPGNRGAVPNLYSSAYLNGIFFCVGGGDGGASGSICKSLDGINWDIQLFTNGAYVGGIANANGSYVAAGSGGIVMRSTDATTWELGNTGHALDVRQLIYAGGRFVAAAGGFRTGGILTSEDGENWTVPYADLDNYMQGITYGNGLYVAVGGNWVLAADGGIVLTSSDGTNWTRRTSGTQGVITGVAYGNGIYVATLYNNSSTTNDIVTSPDGVAWTMRSTGTNAHLSGIGFGDGTFVVVGLNGTLLTSTNGISWAPRRSAAFEDLNGVAYGSGAFIAAGRSGSIVQSVGPSPRFRPEYCRPTADGGMRLIIESPISKRLRLEATTMNALDWVPLVTIANQSTVFELLDPSATNSATRLYRVLRFP